MVHSGSPGIGANFILAVIARNAVRELALARSSSVNIKRAMRPQNQGGHPESKLGECPL
ncbi:hypothetical protein EMIT0P395_130190 [Pseudomonas sp. IT-P395]